MANYIVAASPVESNEVPRATYGIAARDADGTILARVDDISANCNKVRQLAKMCNALDLAPYQLLDVARDFLTAETCLDAPDFIYRVIPSSVRIGKECRRSYGICVSDGHTIVALLENISDRCKTVEKLARKCQSIGLNPSDLADFVANFLAKEAVKAPNEIIYRAFISVAFGDDDLHVTYGIRAIDGRGKTLAQIDDVTTDTERIDQLVDRCQRLGLAPYQLADVVNDFIVSEEC